MIIIWIGMGLEAYLKVEKAVYEKEYSLAEYFRKN